MNIDQTSVFEQIKAKFNPDKKISYKMVAEFKSEIYFLLDSEGKKTNSESKIDENLVQTGLKIQKDIELSKFNTKIKVVSLFFDTSLLDLEDLDYFEVEELWKIIEEKKPDLISFLKLS